MTADTMAVRPMDDLAPLIRPVCTLVGLHETCGFKVCRRAKACATRHVLRYQALEADMRPIVLSYRARRVINALERNADLASRLSPAAEGDYRRLIEWEDEEIALIEAGAYGADDSLTPYRLWLKNFAAPDSRDRAARRAAAGDRKARAKTPPLSPEAVAFRHPGAKLA
jgi:hypothetical protein